MSRLDARKLLKRKEDKITSDCAVRAHFRNNKRPIDNLEDVEESKKKRQSIAKIGRDTERDGFKKELAETTWHNVENWKEELAELGREHTKMIEVAANQIKDMEHGK